MSTEDLAPVPHGILRVLSGGFPCSVRKLHATEHPAQRLYCIADHILQQATLHTRASTRSALAANGVGWVIPATASNGSAQRSGGARPHNVTQLILSSTHRVGAHNGMSAHATGEPKL